mgnify:CR=1 FL=1
MSRQIEQKLQEQYVFYLRSRKVLFCASSGGMRTTMRTAVKMKRAGYSAGHPDIIIYEARGGWHGMAAELKCGSYATPEQKLWQADLTARGYYSIIIPGKLDFWQARDFIIDITDRYLKGEIKNGIQPTV